MKFILTIAVLWVRFPYPLYKNKTDTRGYRFYYGAGDGNHRLCLRQMLTGLAWSARLFFLKTVYYTVFLTEKPSRVRFPFFQIKKHRGKPLCFLEQVMGIEPTRPAWKAGVLPLNYTCIFLPLVSSRNYYITFYNVCQQKFKLLPINSNIFTICPDVY